MKKPLFIFMGFFVYLQTHSASDFVNEFIKKIPTDSMEMLQYSLHEKVRNLNYREKNKVACQKMLDSLHKSLTYEIQYLESQIKNKYFIDQKAAKQAALFLSIAAISTYCTYCFYKDSIQANQAFSHIENECIRKKIKGIDAYFSCYDVRMNKTICEEKLFLVSGVTVCSYFVFWVYAVYAYALDPNRNNQFLLKYQQCLKLVELIQETQA